MASIEEKLLKLEDRLDRIEARQLLIDDVRREMRQLISTGIDESTQTITSNVKGNIKMYADISDKVALLKDMEARLQEVENYRNPNSMNGRIENIMGQIDDINSHLSNFEVRLNSMVKDSKLAEIFTDEELKDLYMSSGLNTNDVKKYIEINFNDGKDVSLVTVSNYINGNIKDILSRSMLGRYFRYEGLKKSAYVKQ